MAQRPSRFERLTNLVLVLLDTSRPLSLREIGATVSGYPSEPGALRQAFERDKRTLRDGGIPVTVERVDGEEQAGYRIIPEQYYLPDLGLEPAEEEALAFAVAAVRLEGGVGPHALAKLGSPGLPELAPVAVLPSLPALGPVHRAVAARSVLSFGYHGRRREVEPYCLLFRAGSWYLFGLDQTAGVGGEQRTFRVDRMEGGPVAGDPGAFDVPEGFDPTTALDLVPFSRGGDELDRGAESVRLEVDARDAAILRALLGATATVEDGADGSARLDFRVGDEEAFVSWVLGFGDSVEVIAPARLREAVVAALGRALAAGADRDPSAEHELETWSPDPDVSSRADGAPTTNLDAGARLRRLLAVLAHLARVGEARVDELAARFSMEPAALVAELELAACCGLPPYTPDELLELVVDDERVVARQLSALHRPPRLTPEEGFAVAAASRALLAVSGAESSGPLSAALGKLEGVLGADRVHVELAAPPNIGPLRRAAALGEIVEIDYLGARRGAESTRRVCPYRVVAREGRWYLDAYCEDVLGWRRFQVDRIAAARPTGSLASLASPPPAFDGPGAFVPGPATVRAVVALPAGRSALLDKVADGPPQRAPGDRVVVPLLVGDRHWLGRLVLSLGDGAEVLEPPELRGVVAEVAAATLGRYRPAED